MSNELKPCPICGGEAHTMQEDYPDVWWVGCKPGGCVATDTHPELEDAIAVWNRRASPAAAVPEGELPEIKPWRERMAMYVSASRVQQAISEAADAEIAELRARLAAVEADRAQRRPRVQISPEMKAAIDKAHETGSTIAETPHGIAFINYGHDYGDNAHLECTACGGSGHIEDQRAIAEADRAQQGEPVDERGAFEEWWAGWGDQNVGVVEYSLKREAAMAAWKARSASKAAAPLASPLRG